MKIKDGFRLRNVMGQATVIGEGTGQVNFNKLITLNATAAWLWEQVEARDFETDTLVSLLMDKYGIDEGLARKDAGALVAKWIETGLVE